MEEAKTPWHQRYIDGDTPWDKGTYTPAVLEILTNKVIPEGKEVLVPGSGYGYDAWAISNAGYTTTGIDIVEFAVSEAQRIHQGAENLSFIKADLFDPELPAKKTYGAIWEHTCYCAILPEQREDYIEAVANLLEKDGLFIGLFFTNTEMPPGEGPPYETSAEDVHRLFSERFELVWEKDPDDTFPQRVGCEWLMLWRKKN